MSGETAATERAAFPIRTPTADAATVDTRMRATRARAACATAQPSVRLTARPNGGLTMPEHDARARYCIQIGVPVERLRDDIRCPACDDMHRLMHLDPGVKEILTPEPWCESCAESDDLS